LQPTAQLDHPTTKAAAAVTLCGVCAFLELYCTQPILPLLARIFHASKTGVGMTVSAATLSAPPFSLSITALSSLFFVYLIGLIVTPFAGYLITRIGLRAGIGGAISCAIAGVLLTLVHSLPVVIIGLAALSSGVFIAQTASQSHLRVASPPGARVTAAGIYITCYYLGGTAAGVVPGAFWAFGKWPACVAFIVLMQLIALTIALIGWRTVTPAQSPVPSPSAAI
jgi:YNFM family putative membrane transporter